MMKSPNRGLRGLTGTVTLGLLWLCLLCPFTAHAQWKWRDANGRLQASDLAPPITVPERDILQRPGAPRTSVAGASSAMTAASPASAATAVPKRPLTPMDRDAEQRRKTEEQDRLARKSAEDERVAAQRKDNCQRARQAVATLESGQRIARVSASGEREILSDEQRAEDLRRAKAVTVSDCR